MNLHSHSWDERPAALSSPRLAQALSTVWAACTALGAGARETAAAASSRFFAPASGETTHDTRGASLRSDYDIQAQRRSLRRAMRLGMWIWPSFTALDAYMCFVLYPAAPFLLFLLYRALIEVVLVVGYQASAWPHLSIRRLVKLQHLAFLLAALGITLMAVHLGGLRSAYMHGISIVCLVHAAVIPAEWRRSLSLFIPIGLVFPTVMLFAAVLWPGERVEWFNPNALAEFAGQYVFVMASSAVAMASGHAVWAAQQQVYRARRLGRYRLQAQLGLRHG